MRAGWALLVLSCACTKSLSPPRVGEPAPALSDSAAERAYQDVLARYSGRAEIYDGFDTRLFAAATLQTWPFREARVRRKAAFQVWPEAEIAKRLEEERADLAKGPELVLGVHVNNSQYDDFDRKDSVWRLALVTTLGESTPVEVDRVGRSNLDLRAMYPYLGEFWVAYRVEFPAQAIDEATSKVKFRLASTLGKAEMELPAR